MSESNTCFRRRSHTVDVCVVGGGMAGICAALAAARQGARVVLMHDRPVLGGNASSECRVHIGGADREGARPFLRETGLLEELRLDSLRHNPNGEYPLFDLVLYHKVQYQPNLTLLLNCSCLDAELAGDSIQSATGWQTTTETYQTVSAKIFIDCSGDGVLAPLTGHPFRQGREARAEYGESIAPETADARTMGLTCLFQAREHDTPQPFEPPSWAHHYDSPDELPYGAQGLHWWRMGYWWIELGGEWDALHDAEDLRQELLRITLGVWDHVKNRGDYGADNWALEWVQMLPAKRESRRYLGAHVLTQHDIESEGKFDDLVAYGGWSMDDHHPAGFHAVKLGAPATIFHPAPSPYGIPYRSLYSTHIANLMFAGRCHSATHAALSSTRVMGTCSSMGQAVGTAAALAAAKDTDPAGVAAHMPELQQLLLADDCYLPWVQQMLPTLTNQASLSASQGDPEPVRDGTGRPVGDSMHAWPCQSGDWVAYAFASPQHVAHATVAFDSDLRRNLSLTLHKRRSPTYSVPEVVPKRFRLEARTDEGWEAIHQVEDNHQRFVRLPIDRVTSGVRLTLEEMWGGKDTRVYTFYLS